MYVYVPINLSNCRALLILTANCLHVILSLEESTVFIATTRRELLVNAT